MYEEYALYIAGIDIIESSFSDRIVKVFTAKITAIKPIKIMYLYK